MGAGTYSQVSGPGDSGYTISYDDQYFQISAEVSFVDDLGNLEKAYFVFPNSVPQTSATERTLIGESELPLDEEVKSLFGIDGYQYKWGGDLGTASDLTYSFASNDTFGFDEAYIDSFEVLQWGTAEQMAAVLQDPDYSLIAFSDDKKSAMREVLDDWADISGISFVEVPESDGNYGELRFFQLNFDNWSTLGIDDELFESAGAFAYLPSGQYDIVDGDIFMRHDYVPGDGTFIGTFSHEVGHALGLSHPQDGTLDNSFLSVSADQSNSTIMGYDADIYDDTGTTLIEPAGDYAYLSGNHPMPLDIEAMEFLYGGNDEVRLDDTPYIFDPELYDPSEFFIAQYRTSILDDGGIDTYDFSLINSDTEFLYIDPSDGFVNTIHHPVSLSI